MIKVWCLIFVVGSYPGVTAVPMETQDQCVAAGKQAIEQVGNYMSKSFACVEGVAK